MGAKVRGASPLLPAAALRQLDNQKAQRLALLEQRNAGITEVTHWIQTHKDQFRGQVGARRPAVQATAVPMSCSQIE